MQALAECTRLLLLLLGHECAQLLKYTSCSIVINQQRNMVHSTSQVTSHALQSDDEDSKVYRYINYL